MVPVARTYYDILRVSPDAETEVIEAAFKTLMTRLKKHPDLGGDVEEAKLINEAREVLTDPARRSHYDSTLSKRNTTEKTADILEQRRAPRHEINSTVSYCISHDLKWYPARVRDVSVLGVRIQSHSALVSGEHVVIAPSNLAAPAIHGTVRWARSFHPSVFERVYEAGIEFSDQIQDVETRFSV